ncbi:MAG: ATP-binding protein [Nanoarchaeota archaeon]
MEKGIIIGGEFGEIILREKQDTNIELGELLIAETTNGKILLQVYNLLFGSQISNQNLELISGLRLEEHQEQPLFDSHLRNYNIAHLKSLILIKEQHAVQCKNLPLFFSPVREVVDTDLSFMTKPHNPLYLGNLRSGSKILRVPVYIDGEKAFSHHILISATTGKGKSNLCFVMLWKTLPEPYCGILVLDPHDEYYGRTTLGLKDHPLKHKAIYYTLRNPPPGARTLKIHLSLLRPSHFIGVIDWTDAQRDFLAAYYRKYGDHWISSILLSKPIEHAFHEHTQGVVKRRLALLLHIETVDEKLHCSGVFDDTIGLNTLTDIVNSLEQANTVIIDTSSFEGSVELLIGSLIANEILQRYKQHLNHGTLHTKPVISIILEEAPRVLGKDVLEQGPNIFSTIAREGRKFKVGLTAITQLPSLIPRDILANINTKIILGVEMKQERQALIESAAQDLSEDDRHIASLDKGEAILTSNFARFATPLTIPLFEEVIQDTAKQTHIPTKISFTDIIKNV